MLGLGWVFDQRTLVIDAASLRLVDGASEQWAIQWISIASLEPIDLGIGQASGLALIGDRDAGTRVIPSSLLEGRVGGTGLIVDVVGLVATLHART